MAKEYVAKIGDLGCAVTIEAEPAEEKKAED